MDIKSKTYLKTYLSSLLPDERNGYHQFDAYYFCADEENANTCAELVSKGEKQATASLYWWYEEEKEPLPEKRNLVVVTDWDKNPQCIIEITQVEIRPFDEVDDEFAQKEGEGDKSLAHWRQEHWKFFSEECLELGKNPDEKMLVVLESFKVVYSGN